MPHRIAAALGIFALASCSPLGAFDVLVPKDRDGVVVVRDAAFGSNPRQRLDVVRPANSDSLDARLSSLGIKVERRTYLGVGHAGLLTAIARPLRGRAPVLSEMSAFARAAAENCRTRDDR